MTIHNKGHKAERDRAVLIAGYQEMCKVFKVPRTKRLDTAAIARLSNEMLYKISKDIYSQATIKQAEKLAVKMGLIKKPYSKFKLKIASIQVAIDLWLMSFKRYRQLMERKMEAKNAKA